MLQNCAADYSISYAMMQCLVFGFAFNNLILVKLRVGEDGELVPLLHAGFFIVISIEK